MAGERKLAGHIRARLDESPKNGKEVVESPMKLVADNTNSESANSWQKKPGGDELEKLSFGKPIRVHVQEFACVFALIAFGVTGYLLYKYNDLETATILSVVGSVLILLGYRAPRLLFPFWKGWMAFAHALGMVMTFLILSFMWTIVALPIALLLRVIGKHVMDMRYDKNIKSYWDEREEKYHDFKLLERQF